MSAVVEPMAAIQLVTQLGEDVLALEIANKQLEASGLMRQMPGLVRIYEMVASDMARVLAELEQAVED